MWIECRYIFLELLGSLLLGSWSFITIDIRIDQTFPNIPVILGEWRIVNKLIIFHVCRDMIIYLRLLFLICRIIKYILYIEINGNLNSSNVWWVYRGYLSKFKIFSNATKKWNWNKDPFHRLNIVTLLLNIYISRFCKYSFKRLKFFHNLMMKRNTFTR